MHFVPDYGGGLLLPQVYCYPLASPRPGKPKLVSFTDDEIFCPEKKGLFQLLVVIHSTAELRDAHKELENLEGRSDEYITISESTTLILSPKSRLVTLSATKYGTFRVATAEEFAASPLCRDRPIPKYYEESRIAKECPDKILLSSGRIASSSRLARMLKNSGKPGTESVQSLVGTGGWISSRECFQLVWHII